MCFASPHDERQRLRAFHRADGSGSREAYKRTRMNLDDNSSFSQGTALCANYAE